MRQHALSLDLLPRLRARDEAAYAEIFRVLGADLIDFATNFVGSADTAEDIVQDVLYRVWAQGEQFAPQGTVPAYLFAAVRNAALDTLRRTRRAQVHAERVIQEHADQLHGVLGSAGETNGGLSADRLADVEQLLASLTEHQRTALQLRFTQGLSIAEVAQVLEISPEGAKKLLGRVIATLREHLVTGN